jgi:flavodoxin
MKTLVAFYSRTGCTRIVAETIAKFLNADILELKEQTGRQGFAGFIKGGYDALRGKPSRLIPFHKDADTYDLVIAGSPVWAGSLCPAVRAFLLETKPLIKEAALFCTHGGGGASKSYATAESILGKPLAATIAIRDKAARTGKLHPAVDDFLKILCH